MLQTLRIRQLVLVEDWTIEFGGGLTSLTGETGAGKSILVGAMALISGQRADRSTVRQGAERAIIEAEFRLPKSSSVREWARDRGLDEIAEEDELIIRREIAAEGSGKVRLNGSPITLSLLRELGEQLFELHGQHEQQSLLQPERHLELIDRFGAHDELLVAVAAAYGELRGAQRRLADLRESVAGREKREAELRADLQAIESVEPVPGEIDKLAAEHRLQSNAEQLGQRLDSALSRLRDSEPSAAALGARAATELRALEELDPRLAELAEQVSSAVLELEDAAEALRSFRASNRHEPGRLQEIEARRAALRDLTLRFGSTEEEVLAHAEKLREERDLLASGDEALGEAEAAVDAAERRYSKTTAALSRARRKTAKAFIPKIEAELAELALGKARFGVEWGKRDEVSVRGSETAIFQLAANPGEGLRPLHKVASGGELSRVMLALHAVLEGAGGGRTLVFDEVDTGVGGAVADAIGRRLAALGRHHQLVCITHLPQVAAFGDRHLRIEKSDASGRTLSAIVTLKAKERVEELARMLGGREPTSLSRRHAKELLVAAESSVAGERV